LQLISGNITGVSANNMYKKGTWLIWLSVYRILFYQC